MADIELDIGNRSVTDDEEETEALTAAEVLQKLEDAMLNEKFCPELLEQKMDVVECMLEQVEQMEENISHARTGDFKIDRIRYMLSSYLRTRLKKIEQYTSPILETEKSADTPRLSPEELV
ncbi:hypothetical protein NP493_976g00000 [Ridgeia piscesae]|uniref:GINS complex subunit 4 n=1 Tax=Ridgeia piscesae TaxID=27915 RepID=A0AAD9KJE9_RIDPI|nr:hypothetical protein NP493_976g00000 [Ridgeia piscesae]